MIKKKRNSRDRLLFPAISSPAFPLQSFFFSPDYLIILQYEKGKKSKEIGEGGGGGRRWKRGGGGGAEEEEMEE